MFHLIHNCKNVKSFILLLQVLFILASREASDYRNVKIQKLYELNNIAEINVDNVDFQLMESFVIRNFFNFAIKIDHELFSFINNRYGGK